jgi:hypothetical protein
MHPGYSCVNAGKEMGKTHAHKVVAAIPVGFSRLFSSTNIITLHQFSAAEMSLSRGGRKPLRIAFS